jgi:DNA-binding beta-propeller fold protein YncE
MNRRLSALLVLLPALLFTLPAAARAQQVIQTIAIPPSNGASQAIPNGNGAAFDAGRNRLYEVVSYLSGTAAAGNALAVIDGATDSFLAAVPIAAQIGANCAYNPVNDTIYVPTFQGGILLVDPDSLSMTGAIAGVPESSYVAVDEVANRIYASDTRAARIHVIDGTTNQVLGQIALDPRSIFPGELVVNPGANRLYMTYRSGPCVLPGGPCFYPLVVIDLATNSVAAQLDPLGSPFSAMALDRAHGRLYVGESNARALWVLDLASETFSAQAVPVPGTGSIRDLAFNSSSNRLYMTRVPGGTLEVLDPASFALLGMLQVSNTDLFGISVDEAAGRLFLADRGRSGSNPEPGRIHVVLDARRVRIDIKPGSQINSINLGSNGTVAVAILSDPGFDAATVDPLTVTLASARVRLKGKGTPMASLEDVNGDGLPDLVVHVETEALELSAGDAEAKLAGATSGGQTIAGSDTVRVVP